MFEQNEILLHWNVLSFLLHQTMHEILTSKIRKKYDYEIFHLVSICSSFHFSSQILHIMKISVFHVSYFYFFFLCLQLFVFTFSFRFRCVDYTASIYNEVVINFCYSACLWFEIFLLHKCCFGILEVLWRTVLTMDSQELSGKILQ